MAPLRPKAGESSRTFQRPSDHFEPPQEPDHFEPLQYPEYIEPIQHPDIIGPLPAPAEARAAKAVAGLREVADRLRKRGELESAEFAYLKLIACGADGEIRTMGVDMYHLARVCYNRSKLDDAMKHLLSALEIFERSQTADVFVVERMHTRSLLGRIYEMRGKFQQAAYHRYLRNEGMVLCTDVKCGNTIKINNGKYDPPIEGCAACKCVIYCNIECAGMDKHRHRKYCRGNSPPIESTESEGFGEASEASEDVPSQD